MNNVVSLDELFQKRIFRVPDYQRGYSWEERQIQEFLEDLEILGPKVYHYTGTVILHPLHSESESMDEDGNHYACVAVVDGQQRITTIVLLLDGIRRLLAKSTKRKDRSLSRGIRKNFIAARATTREPLYKLTLDRDADRFFRASVLSDQRTVEGATISSHKRLVTAKEEIAHHLETNIADRGTEGIKWLRNLYDKLTKQLRFTVYEVENEAEVGVIFEVMNDRGKPLTELEKVKNFLLHTSFSLTVSNEPHRLAEAVNEAWAEILRQLMAAHLESSADEDRLLRAHWLIHHDPQPRQWHGSRSIKDYFALRKHRDNQQKLLERLHLYTTELREDCVAFCDAYYPTAPNAFDSFKVCADIRVKVIGWSEKLVRIGVVPPFLPLLIAARHRWPEQPQKYLQLLKICETFAFRVYRVMGWRSDAGQSTLFGIGHKVWKRESSYKGMLRDIKSELERRCKDEDFDRFTDAGKPDNWYSWSGLRYFLYEYEMELASRSGTSPEVTWDELRSRDLKDTIEHILPQTIDGRSYWKNRFSEKKHRKYVHDLGNLTLTKHNPQYSNKSFPKKKGKADAEERCYANSPFYMERDLMLWKDWDDEAINKRRANLLDWASTRWALT